MVREIYLVRHGAADRTGDYETAPGPGLNERGRFEAYQAACFLSGRGVARLYVSPFRRARETAEQIGEQLGLLLSLREGLAEARRDESVDSVRERVLGFLHSLEEAPLPVVAVVSHGTPLLVLRAELRGEAVDLRPPPAARPRCPARASGAPGTTATAGRWKRPSPPPPATGRPARWCSDRICRLTAKCGVSRWDTGGHESRLVTLSAAKSLVLAPTRRDSSLRSE
jgi:broad specificity phosphatase PhoE